VVLAKRGLSYNRHIADSAETSPYRIVDISAQIHLALGSGFGYAFFLFSPFFCADHDAHLLDGLLSI
jgi:hypothetical protein